MELLLEGKSVAENIKSGFGKRIENLEKKPNIAVLGIKGDEASLTYIKRIEKNCEKYGIGFTLKLALNEDEFVENFDKIKNDENFTGIMFQQPLSKKMSNLINEIPAEKDIEGVSNLNLGKLLIGEKDVNIPCTSKAVIEILDYYNIDLTGKNVTIVGRSNIVGKPMAMLMLKENATVTIAHSRTKDLKEVTKRADIIVAAIGKAKFVTADYVKEGAVVIDVGMDRDENGKLCGDVDFESVSKVASAITPVPGGVGPMTVTMLLVNCLRSVELNK